jgi:hypothetical protein
MPKSLAILLSKRYKLAYSRMRDDRHKVYGLYVFNPHFLDIIAARCTKDVEEAKKRVTITCEGKYKYEPSKEYMEFKLKLLKKQFNNTKTGEHGRIKNKGDEGDS